MKNPSITDDSLERLRMAKHNLELLAHAYWGVEDHPVEERASFSKKLAKLQKLDDCIWRLEQKLATLYHGNESGTMEKLDPRKPMYFALDKEYAGKYGQVTEAELAPDTKILDGRTPEGAKVIAQLVAEHKEGGDQIHTNPWDSDLPLYSCANSLQYLATPLGYDGAVLSEMNSFGGNGVKSVVVWNTHKIKTAALADGLPMDVINAGIEKSEPLLIPNFPIKRISISIDAFDRTSQDNASGASSKTREPIALFYDTDQKQFLVEDGMHRLVAAIRRRERTIAATVWSGYSDYIANVRPDDKMKLASAADYVSKLPVFEGKDNEGIDRSGGRYLVSPIPQVPPEILDLSGKSRIVNVNVADLHSRQQWLVKEKLTKGWDLKEPPTVTRNSKGKLVIADGNHRVIYAIANGKTTMPVLYVEPPTAKVGSNNLSRKEASHKQTPLSDTTFPNMDNLDGEGTNSYSLQPEKVDGTEMTPSLEELAPQMFKKADNNEYMRTHCNNCCQLKTECTCGKYVKGTGELTPEPKGGYEPLPEPKKRKSPYLYHVTHKKNLPSIIADGLYAANEGGMSFDSAPLGLYLSEEGGVEFWVELSQQGMGGGEGYTPVVLRVPRKGLKLTLDEAGSEDAGDNCYITEAVIPASKIQIQTERGWRGVISSASIKTSKVEEDENICWFHDAKTAPPVNHSPAYGNPMNETPRNSFGPYGRFVEWLPTELVMKFREYDREDGDADYLDGLTEKIKREGFKEPFLLEYSRSTRTALLTEGNHRLAVAVRLGWPEVPVRVYRREGAFNRGAGVPVPGFDETPYWNEDYKREITPHVPADMKPSDIGVDTGTEKTAAAKIMLKSTAPDDLMQGYYEGGCYALALALKEVYGFQVFGVFDEEGACIHAFAADPTHNLAYDMSGMQSFSEAPWDYPGEVRPYPDLTVPESHLIDAISDVKQYLSPVQQAGEHGKTAKLVYHGTPHEFDSFSTDGIGSGEGNQSFGWGLYFTDTKQIAERYRDILTHYKAEAVVKSLIQSGISQETAETFAEYYAQVGRGGAMGVMPFTSFAEAMNQPAPYPPTEAMRERMRRELPKLKEAIRQIKGKLYAADIPEDDVMLLWDKPLSEQSPKVQQALQPDPKVLAEYERLNREADKLESEGQRGSQVWNDLINRAIAVRKKYPVIAVRSYNPNDGQSLYRALSTLLGTDKRASKVLEKLGIKGVKYLDGGSRNAGTGSYNYVIFDDRDVKNVKIGWKKAGEGDMKPSDIGVGTMPKTAAIPADAIKVYKSGTKTAAAKMPGFDEVFGQYGMYDIITEWEPYEAQARVLAEKQGLDLSTLNDDDKDKWIFDHVAIQDLRLKYEKLNKFFSNLTYPLTVYRAIELEDISNLRTNTKQWQTAPDTFGHCWAWDERGAQAYCSEEDGTLFIFKAELPGPNYVDWVTTIGCNFMLPEEHEIRVIAGRQLSITGWKKAGEGVWNAPEESFRTVIAHDYAMKTADYDDGMYAHCDGQMEAAMDILAEYQAHYNEPTYHMKWRLVPAARIIKIWQDYMKLGWVQDEKGLESIAATIVTNINKLEVNTILCGHSQENPVAFAQDILGESLPEDYFEHEEEFFEDENGAWRISDYAMDKLTNLAIQLRSEFDSTKKLQLIDQILSIVHCRSDLSGWLIQGGRTTLNKLYGANKSTKGRGKKGAEGLYSSLLKMKNEIAASAQRVYDDWSQDPEHWLYEPGGICDGIVEQINGDVLEYYFSPHALYLTVGRRGNKKIGYHAFNRVSDGVESCVIDINPFMYETYKGQTPEGDPIWEKKPEVVFKASDVEIKKVPVTGNDREWFKRRRRRRASIKPTFEYQRGAEGLKVFHLSPFANITEFRPFTHFGTLKAAEDRGKGGFILGESYVSQPVTIYEVTLSINNPLEVPDLDTAGRTAHHTPMKLADQLFYKMKVITVGERDAVIRAAKSEPAGYAELAKVLQGHGYDGLKYTNRFEDPCSASYVIFTGSQAKIIGKYQKSGKAWQKVAAKKEWLHGYCHTFTVALHKLTGYPCYFIHEGKEGVVHSCVKTPDNRFLDYSGFTSLPQMAKLYGLEKPYAQPAALAGVYEMGCLDWPDESGDEDFEVQGAMRTAKMRLKKLGIPVKPTFDF